MKYVSFLLCAILAAMCIVAAAEGAHKRLEKSYQAEWCGACGGSTEYCLPCGARVDCLTEEYAIEFDFCSKWAEAVGQALYYAECTGKKPGIVLIIERPRDRKALARLLKISSKYGIKVWTMDD